MSKPNLEALLDTLFRKTDEEIRYVRLEPASMQSLWDPVREEFYHVSSRTGYVARVEPTYMPRVEHEAEDPAEALSGAIAKALDAIKDKKV